MKKKVSILFFLFILLLLSGLAKSQGFTTKGTDFWLGFIENYLGDDTTHSDRMKVYVTTDNQAATGTISLPLGGWSVNYSIAANSTYEVTIPTNLAMCTASDAIENKGIHVTSDVQVSVYQLNYVQYTSDANIVIPTTSLGKKYRVTTYQPTGAKPAWTEVSISELLVVAAYDSTVIRITPKCNTQGGHGANVPFNITLNRGQVYPIKSYPTSSYSLTGSLIEIDTNAPNNCKPFAVFSGNQCAFIPGDSCCCNIICEEMMPINSWGKQYVTVPLKTRSSDIFRFVGQQNGTVFTINGGTPHGLNAGGYYEEDISTASFISSNYPISVAQFSKSAGTDGNVNSDPFMIMINPLEQTIKRIVFNSFVTSIISNYYVNIISRTAYTGLVTLDGVNMASSFHPVTANPQYSYAQIVINQGNHILVSDSGLIANVYGYGNYESYGYIAGATVKNLEIGYSIITPTDTFAYFDLSDTLCKNTPLTFTATFSQYITDYSWNFGDGSPIMHGQTVSHTFSQPGSFNLTYYYLKNGACGFDSIVWPIHFKCCNLPPGITGSSPACVGSTVTVKDSSAFNPNVTYTWNFGNANVISGSGQGPYALNWNSAGFDTLWCSISELNCPKDSASFPIQIITSPTSSFTVVSPLCPGEASSIVYTGNAPATSTYLWDFDGGNIISGTGQGPYDVAWVIPGTHQVKLTVSLGGCDSSTTIPVVVHPPPIPNFSPNPQTVFIETPLVNFFDNSLNTNLWSWNFGDASSGAENFSTLSAPSHSYFSQGNYQVILTVTSPDGCKDSLSRNVNVVDINTFYIPNAFTPGTGLNDIFQPYSTKMDYTLYIFNRWGEEIFKGYNQGWDGTYQGKYAIEGVYVWYLVYSFPNEPSNSAYGNVTLLKY